MPISSKLPLKKNIHTVHNLITFSIVSPKKNRIQPPPPLIKTKLKYVKNDHSKLPLKK